MEELIYPMGAERYALDPDVVEELVFPALRRLHELEQLKESATWDQAVIYNLMYEAVAHAQTELGLFVTAQSVNRCIRSFDWYDGPGSSYLSSFRKVHSVFPQFFVEGAEGLRDRLSYTKVREIAYCSLSQEEKDELLQISMSEKWTFRRIRDEIKDLKAPYEDFDDYKSVSTASPGLFSHAFQWLSSIWLRIWQLQQET